MDTKTVEAKPHKTIGKNEMDVLIADFLKELEETLNEGWQMTVEKKNLTVARKRTPGTDVYRLRMVGHLPYPVEIVDIVLNNMQIRMKWDKVMTAVETIETVEGGLEVVYMCISCPPGISNRDFVHVRVAKENEAGARIVLDKSVTHPAKPPSKGYIRANTIFSGLVLSKRYIQDGNKSKEATHYAAISQVDVCGELPKLILNAVAAMGTADWFASLDKACAAYMAGTLGVK